MYLTKVNIMLREASLTKVLRAAYFAVKKIFWADPAKASSNQKKIEVYSSRK